MSKVSIDFEVHTFQIDFVHHVSNIVYLEWMEIARTKLLEKVGFAVADLEESNIFPVLSHTEIDYKKPIYFGDNVTCEISISELGAASAIMVFNIYKNGSTLCATAKQKGLFINGSTKRPQRLSKEQASQFEKFLVKCLVLK